MTINKAWKPVHRGKIYCSPRCGGKCTHAAFLKATRDAEALAKRVGDGWKPRVWENLGWHYSIQKEGCEIYPHINKSKVFEYWADFHPKDGAQIHFTAKSPEAALQAIARRVKAIAASWATVMA